MYQPCFQQLVVKYSCCFFTQFLISICFGFKLCFLLLITSAPSSKFERTSFLRGTRAEAKDSLGQFACFKVQQTAKSSASWRLSLQSLCLSIYFYLQTVIAELHHVSKIHAESVYYIGRLAHTFPLKYLFTGSRPMLLEVSLCSRALETCYRGLIFSTRSCISST